MTNPCMNAEPLEQKSEPQAPRSSVKSLLNRVWPVAVLAIALAVTVAWIGLLGYGLAMLF